MAKNALWDLRKYGQSVWYDSISRGIIGSGQLQSLVEDDAVVGVTSNPTIFEAALGGSADYDENIRALAEAGEDADAIFRRVSTDDIRQACDVLKPIYEATNHEDGRVSIEVGPGLAHDTETTKQEARNLWQIVDRPNVMIKIPGTHEGVPAIEEMIYEGLSINVTLLFAVSMYEKVMEAYITGLERRAAENKPLDQIFSVASFFVSRVDTMVDKELDAKIAATEDSAEQERLRALHGKAAIANAKLAYQAFKRVFSETNPRWQALAAKGANVQRPLWASTSTKNKAYPDTLYIAELVGPQTVNTIPESALKAFADHGEVRGSTVEQDVEAARAAIAGLAEAGVDLNDITENRLVAEGVASFAKSFDNLIGALAKKRDAILAEQHA
jgi:transaldolase